jgi:hypothetical protein
MDARSGRRKFLQGSLAAPVVLTVSSPSAAVASFGRCLAKLEGLDPPFFGRDNFFRAQVGVDQLALDTVIQGYFYPDPAENKYVNCDTYGKLNFGPNNLPTGWQITGYSSRWALVWFQKNTMEQYSKITVQRPSGYLAATVSCYNSFTAG